MESMFKLFEEEEEVHLKLTLQGLHFYCCIMICFFILSIFLLLQVKDEVNAGNLQYRQGKVEFENVYFSYISGLVHIYFDGLILELIIDKVVT